MEEWKFTCKECEEKQIVRTNFSKREAGDKATIKEINTSVLCPNCGTMEHNIDPRLQLSPNHKLRLFNWLL